MENEEIIGHLPHGIYVWILNISKKDLHNYALRMHFVVNSQ